MDVGAEYEHYTADVTRTYPVNGKFTKEQADIYRIVYDAQEAVGRATKPGATMADLSKIATDTIADGLMKLGLIEKKEQTRLWFIHGLGHWLGMNVHDVGRYGVPLKAGMVFTNEPGSTSAKTYWIIFRRLLRTRRSSRRYDPCLKSIRTSESGSRTISSSPRPASYG
jgi:Xaa-Pro aminopeptidase